MPETEACGVCSFVDRAREPFHPRRLFDAAPREHWLDHEQTLDWIAEKWEEKWEEPTGDCRQEIVFIGIGMDLVEMTRTLDSCRLTDAENALPVARWQALVDPLPGWEPQVQACAVCGGGVGRAGLVRTGSRGPSRW